MISRHSRPDYRLFLLDFDDTTVECSDVDYASFAAVLGAKAPSKRHLLEWRRQGWRAEDILDAVVPDASPLLVEARAASLRSPELWLDHCRLKGEALGFLKELNQRKVPVYIVTRKEQQLARLIAAHLGIDDLLCDIYTTEDKGGVARGILTQGAQPAAFVSDTLDDLWAMKELPVDCFRISSTYRPRSYSNEFPVIDTLTELLSREPMME